MPSLKLFSVALPSSSFFIIAMAPQSQQQARRPTATRVAAAFLCGAAAWNLTSPSAFTPAGHGVPSKAPRTQHRGYRLDWMLEQKDGTNDLQTQDGYWVGETGFEKSQMAQGLRYRMRPTQLEYKEGTEVNNLMFKFGPLKFKLGEAFGGTGNNKALRDLKRRIVREGITDKAKQEENEYWIQRYGHKRWVPQYIDQSTGLAKTFLRGLAAWSAGDPLQEERGITWTEADYGKPWLAKYVGMRQKGWVTEEQVKKEYDTGRLLNK